MPIPKKGSETRTVYDRLWRLVSEYIRRRDKGVCFTCGCENEWKRVMAGHMIHKKDSPIHFHEQNVHAQCNKCNRYLSGNLIKYLRNVQRKYGTRRGDWLIKEGEKVHEYTLPELLKLEKKYKKKLEGLTFD